MEIALGILGGGLITILTAVLIEYARMPKLHLSIEGKPCDITYEPGKSPAKDARYLRLVLRNAPLPRMLRWLQRSAALQCHGKITFHHLDGQRVFDREMTVRWASCPEPLWSQIQDSSGKTHFVIVDFVRAAMEPRVDVYPGEEKILDVVVRFDDDEDCYGWNDEAYRHAWRNPDWKLKPGRYLAKAIVTSAGQRCAGIVRIVNDVARSDFRLEPPFPEDYPKLR